METNGKKLTNQLRFEEAQSHYADWAMKRGKNPEQPSELFSEIRDGSWHLLAGCRLLAVVHSTGEVVGGDDYRDSQRRSVFARLKDKGVALVEVEFSGGHDEGGVDSIVLYDAEGAEIERLDEDDELGEALSEPIYDKYSTFAGEFSVTGVVTWNVVDETAAISGDESNESWENFEEEL